MAKKINTEPVEEEKEGFAWYFEITFLIILGIVVFISCYHNMIN